MQPDGLPPRDVLRSFVGWGTAACMLVLVVIVGVLTERAHPSPTEIFMALGAQTYEAPLPRGLEIDYQFSRSTSGGLGSISFADIETRRRVQGGGVVVISYEVFDSSKEALRAFSSEKHDLLEANQVFDRGYRFWREPDVSRVHYCVDQLGSQAWCQAVVGDVRLEALSRIHLSHPDRPSQVGTLLRSALAHLARTTRRL